MRACRCSTRRARGRDRRRAVRRLGGGLERQRPGARSRRCAPRMCTTRTRSPPSRSKDARSSAATPSGCGPGSRTLAWSAPASASATAATCARRRSCSRRTRPHSRASRRRTVSSSSTASSTASSRRAAAAGAGVLRLYGAATQLGVLPSRGTLGEKALLMLRGFGLRAGRGTEAASRQPLGPSRPRAVATLDDCAHPSGAKRHSSEAGLLRTGAKIKGGRICPVIGIAANGVSRHHRRHEPAPCRHPGIPRLPGAGHDGPVRGVLARAPSGARRRLHASS